MTEGEECGDPVESTGETCENEAKFPDGKCGYHTRYGNDDGGDKQFAPGFEHGLYADRSNYYDRLDSREQEWVDTITYQFVQDAPFDETHLGKVEQLRQVAIDYHKRRRANDMLKDQMTKEETTDYHDQYGPLTKEKEHPAHMIYDRLGRNNIRQLKELGVLDDEGNEEEVGRTVIEALSHEIDEDEDE